MKEKLMDSKLVSEDVKEIIKFQGPGCEVNFRELNLFQKHLTEKNCFKELISKQACQLFKFTKIETVIGKIYQLILLYCNQFTVDNENQAVDADILALDQSTNKLVVQDDNTQSEYVPAICAPVRTTVIWIQLTMLSRSKKQTR